MPKERSRNNLRELLAEMTAKVEGEGPLDPEFDADLDDLLAAIRGCAHEEFTQPINRKNFEARLEQIRRAYKLAEFTDDLREAGRNLYHFLLGENLSRNRPHYYKACTLVYELHDALPIDPKINAWAEADAKKVYEWVQAHPSGRVHSGDLTESEREVYRERVLWCTCYGNELKRNGRTQSALDVFNALYSFTERTVKSDEMPCYATRAIISYHLGSVYRRREEHKKAEEMYTRAVEFYFARAHARKLPGELEELIFSTRRVAMCIGLGMGWVNLTRGFLGRAENALATARTLMAHINDPVHRYYIDMIWGTIRRCRAGSKKEKLEPAIKALIDARDFFESKDHPRFHARVCWELALAYNRAGDYKKSEEHLQQIEKFSGTRKSVKWKTNVHIMRSRNWRAQGEAREDEKLLRRSLDEAEKALTQAEKSSEPLPSADALITVGEARLSLAAVSAQADATNDLALQDFKRALEKLQPQGEAYGGAELSKNPKIAAVCLLRLAQCHVREKRWQEAQDYLERWKRLQHLVEHEWVHELADRVNRDLSATRGDFIVPADDPGALNATAAENALKEWLARRALEFKDNDYDEAAKLLGRDRKTVKNWLKPSGENANGVNSKGAKKR